MDVQEASGTTPALAKSAVRLPVGVMNALDALAAPCAPFAARWDAEADRRAKLRTPEHLKALMDAQKAHNSARTTAASARSQRSVAKSASRNPLSTGRRAAATAHRAASKHQAEAKGKLRAARKNYPTTLAARAVQAHALHALPAAVASWAMSAGHDLTVWPAGVSAGLIGANVAALWLGRRTATLPVDEALSAEERQLVARLDPTFWVGHAADRGLSGTVTTPPEVGRAGISCDVRLDGTWTLEKFKAAEANVRALLGARTGLRVQIKAGSRGGWALLLLRTRSAADGDDLRWSFDARSFGIDTITGDVVTIPLGERLLIAGRSGAGKSVASRPLLFDASDGPTNALAIIDLKQVEGRLWDHRARVASTPVDVVDLVDDLVAEMTERLAVLPKGQATWTPTEARPRITLVVDEGAEVVSACSAVEMVVGVTEAGREVVKKRSALEGLESIARMGRAACIDLWWMTQKPTIGSGVPQQIAPQVGVSICLAVRTPSEARVVLGEDAQAKGWNADELPAPGVALVRDGKRAAHPIAVRYMTDNQVIALPNQPIWGREAAPAETERPALRLVKGASDYELQPPAAAPAQAGPVSNRDRVLAAVVDGARTGRDITDRTGLNKGTVSREIKALITAGVLVKGDDGMLTARGVSA